MFVIGEATVQEDVVSVKFACDHSRCKGACCTMKGGNGAPLLDEEIEKIQKAAPFARRYLSETHKQLLDELGFYEGKPGDYSTLCLYDRACVFVYYEGEIARCSLERAYIEGLTDWIKPMSCHLFPVRISNGTGTTLRYERISECSPGRDRGKREGISLPEFLEDSLRRRFGTEWYEELSKVKKDNHA
jgi:Fe-S-cluster containining protein